MILGLGLDVVEAGRLERAVSRHGDRFLEEILGGVEIDRFRRTPRFIHGCATAFAAKEALFKALGTGRAGKLSWHDVDVDGSPPAPCLRLVGEAERRARELGVRRVFLSLAGSGDLAVAMVVLEGVPPPAGQGRG